MLRDSRRSGKGFAGHAYPSFAGLPENKLKSKNHLPECLSLTSMGSQEFETTTHLSGWLDLIKMILGSDPENSNSEEKLPAIGECVLVRCDGFTCMAFRDIQGKWRDYFRQELLEGPVKVLKVLHKP